MRLSNHRAILPCIPVLAVVLLALASPASAQAPPQPGFVSVPVSSAVSSYSVSWGSSAGATYYELQEANNVGMTGASTVYNGPSLSFAISTHTTGTWYYQVRAGNLSGTSAYLVATNGCVLIAPLTPAWITVPITSPAGSFTVQWASSTGATFYQLQEDTNAGFTAPTNIYNGPSTAFSVSSKTSGTYYYRVLAGNAAGSSAWIAGANGCTIVPPSAPGTPSVPSTTPANYSTFISWGTVSGATVYECQEDTNAGFTAPTSI